MSDFNLLPILPELFLAICAMGLLIVGVFNGNKITQIMCWASVAVFTITLLLLLGIGWEQRVVLNGMFILDSFGGFIKVLILLGLIVTMAMSVRYLKNENMARFEYPVLVMMAGVGMMLMVSSHNLLALYMGLELQSLSLYVLAAFNRNSLRSSEAGIKYFVLGALSSGMLLYGISLIYGYVGSLDFTVIGDTLVAYEGVPYGAIVGLVFILAGLSFKISAVPFHMWTPDVYQGAPTCVTALFAIVPKIAAMGLLIRLIYDPFISMQVEWTQILYFVSLASMILGAFAGVVQNNIKRLLAYSSIGNMGYILVGVIAGTPAGVGSVLLYLLVYFVMTAGVFTIVLGMRRNDMAVENISDLGGLSKHNPVQAYALAILMFSMSGIPPMAGFFAKLLVFQAAVAQGYYVLAVLGILTSVVAAYYYLRIIKVMFFDEVADPLDQRIPFARRVILFLSIIFIIGFVLFPSVFVQMTHNAAFALFAG